MIINIFDYKDCVYNNERSFTNTAILLNLSIEEIKHKYQLFLEVFYRIFQKEFYS